MKTQITIKTAIGIAIIIASGIIGVGAVVTNEIICNNIHKAETTLEEYDKDFCRANRALEWEIEYLVELNKVKRILLLGRNYDRVRFDVLRHHGNLIFRYKSISDLRITDVCDEISETESKIEALKCAEKIYKILIKELYYDTPTFLRNRIDFQRYALKAYIAGMDDKEI